MSRRRNKRDELDFEIHVDPSEDIAPMEDSTEHHEVIADFSDIGAGGFTDEDDNHSAFEPNWISHGGSELNGDSDSTEPAVRQSIEEHEEMEEAGSRRESATSRRSSARSSTQGHDDLRQNTLRGKHQYRTSVAASDDSYGSSSSRQSMSVASEGRMSTGARSQPSGGEDSGSHRDDQEDDVFSDNSPRSSMGSIPEADQHKLDDAGSRRTTTSRISDIAPYDPEEEFIPTVRGTPRPPFRSPSSVRDLQMNSPPASVIGSPRQSKGTPRRSTMSRLGSPSTQFSPKKTPPRFKRNTPPLVLLHVTLLPLRWPWGDLLDSVRPSELTEAGKALREAWRQLQDRIGDTVCDRGILLPHPQNDFEVLEERLLEAVELPLRRRARILECGHYLGPANEMALAEDMDSEDEDYEARLADDQSKTHWCSTCHSEIRYDSLGEGRVFRTKVYASNGLMKAGAWDACWKQMERVDVEVEPIVDELVLDELEHLAAEQSARLDEEHELEADGTMYEATTPHEATTFSSPPPQPAFEETPLSGNRRMREEERLREIYGQSPPPEPAPSSVPAPRPEEFIAPETPPSPTVEAMERRESRRQSYKSASLPELVLEAVKVLMKDKKNVAIAMLGLIAMMLAVRSGQEPVPTKVIQPIVQHEEPVVSREHPAGYEVEKGADPCAPCSLALEAAQASCAGGPATVTVTETYTASVTVEATAEATTADAAATEEAQHEVEELVEEVHAQSDMDIEDADAAEHEREL